jgi:hypothetical protein
MTSPTPAHINTVAEWAASQGQQLEEEAREVGQEVGTRSPEGRAANQQPHDDAPMAEANVFAMSPDGFKVHIKLPSRSMTIIGNVDLLLKGLAAKGYTPDPTMGGFRNAPAAPVAAAQPAPAQPVPNGPAQWIHNPDGSRSCSVHGPAKWVPPGVSRNTGQPFTGFWSCSVRACKPAGEN